jgi:LmbE family N-acetylglucosaminyl deacetylase
MHHVGDRALETMRPDIVLTVGSDGLTGHPDHIACHNAVARALASARCWTDDP